MTNDFRDRFMKKVVVSDNGCWKWIGAKSKKGYGVMNRGRDDPGWVKAHRASYKLHVGPIAGGLHVLHRCDNPGCVRPDHLFLGTNEDNMKDASSKGRIARGESSGMSTLTEDAVLSIRRECETGRSRSSVARQFGIASATVSKIVLRQRWAHVF